MEYGAFCADNLEMAQSPRLVGMLARLRRRADFGTRPGRYAEASDTRSGRERIAGADGAAWDLTALYLASTDWRKYPLAAVLPDNPG